MEGWKGVLFREAGQSSQDTPKLLGSLEGMKHKCMELCLERFVIMIMKMIVMMMMMMVTVMMMYKVFTSVSWHVALALLGIWGRIGFLHTMVMTNVGIP